MLKRLSIEHFKGFYDRQTVDFAIPDQENGGSGLTLIVGPNNAGKTTIIESLLFNTEKRLKESERHPDRSPTIEITNTKDQAASFTNVNNGSLICNVGIDHGLVFELIPSRRFWENQFNGSWQFGNLIQKSISSELRSSQILSIGPILKTIQEDARLKDRFDNYLKRVVPHFSNWNVDTDDAGQDYIKYQTNSGGYHKANLLGDGIISLFRIVAHLVHDEDSTFIIDEPELSLHPASQRRLSSILSELSMTKQIIVSTHSPHFANWKDFENGAKYVRLNKHEDRQCTTHALHNDKDYARFISDYAAKYQKPQLLDVAAKEILFNDKVLFLEGQEDVGIIRKWYEDNERPLNYEIFGYGVDGETNMKLFLELSRDLGLKRVAALYDKGTQSYDGDRREYPDFHLHQLSTEDIRDKISSCPYTDECPNGKNREGTFDSKGVLKPEQGASFVKILEAIEVFMRG